MDDIWIISWFNHTAFDANPIWKSPIHVFIIKHDICWVLTKSSMKNADLADAMCTL